MYRYFQIYKLLIILIFLDNVLESIENNMPLLLPEECEEILNNVILENELDLGNDEVFEPLDIMNMPVVLDNCEPNILCNKPPINETLITNISQINNQKLLKSKLSEVQWKKANFYMDPQFLKFETEPLPNKITSLKSPIDFFSYFFTDDLYQHIMSQSQLYSIQCDVNKPVNITKIELQQYIGICLFTSIVVIPNVRRYWNTNIGFTLVKETMSVNRFEKIRRFIHFNDNSQALSKENVNHDRLYKLRPIVDFLNEKFGSVPLERDLSIDEQLCATKAHSYLKQYLPLKPHKWGYKFFVMCGSNGFSYRFELYTGQENQDKYRLPSEPDLMASANVVVRLSRIIPENKNHRVFFDNYYTTIPLLTFMAKKGIHTLGTVRRNRLPNCQFISEKIMNNQARGTAFEYITVFDDIPLTSVVWKDNKIVTLLSSYCGILPKNSIKRFDKKTKRILDVNCPAIIKDYNRHMGGVDLLDSLIGRYKIRMRTKKWYMRIWYHLIDVTVVNAWLLYRRVEVLNDRKPTMSLFDFRLNVSYSLTKVGTTTPKRGRPPTSVLKEMAIKKRKPNTSLMPTDSVRKDCVDHWPEYVESRQRCKLNGCGKLTNCTCTKCNNYFCCGVNRNCFTLFHKY